MKFLCDKTSVFIRLGLFEKFLSARFWSLSIPINNIKDVSTDIPIPSKRQIKIGTWFPKIIKAGTFLTENGKEFWYVTPKNPTVTITLKEGFYKRIIISSDENEKMKQIIQKMGNFDV